MRIAVPNDTNIVQKEQKKITKLIIEMRQLWKQKAVTTVAIVLYTYVHPNTQKAVIPMTAAIIINMLQ